MAQAPGTFSFVGAGPGDPELLTIKGRKAIEGADLVLYAGSRIPWEIVGLARECAEVHDASLLTLEESHSLARLTALKGGNVARIHPGDPSLYGSLREQAALLDRDGIPWRIIPGITAACAAAAEGGISLTNMEQGQSLIITRMAGNTPIPPDSSVPALASHKTAMAIYLSGKQSSDLQKQLSESLEPATPVLCVHKTGWPDSRLVWTTVERLHQCVLDNCLERQTVFLVLPGQNEKGAK